MFDFAAARKKMVENQLRTSGITDRRLLAVMAQLPREQFVPAERRELAYIDEAHRLPSAGDPRYLAAPAPFGRMVQLAAVDDDDKVLDVGCGTGYSTAVLASLAMTVVAVEGDAALAAAARTNLASLGMTEALVIDGPIEAASKGQGPFDVIILEGAVESVPDALLQQLAEGGRLIALLKNGASAVVHSYVRAGRDIAGRPEFNTTLPPLPAAKRPSEFIF